jgi:uncharacterized protein with beta-barrel porin domain
MNSIGKQLGAHWSEQYVGTPYTALNCAQLVAHALRTHFDRDDIALILEGAKQHGEGTAERSAAIKGRRGDVASRVDTQVVSLSELDGYGVLLQVGVKLQHMGLVAVVHGCIYILHTTRKSGAVLERLDRVARAYKIEGFYKWNDK